MSKLIIVGDRLDFKFGTIRDAFFKKDKDFIIDLARRQIHAGAKYLNIRVGPYKEDAGVMAWVVKKVQEELDNVPLFLNSDNAEVIEAGLKVYDRTNEKPVVNSADAGARKDFINLAADYEAKVVCVCMKDEVPMNESERISYCSSMLTQGIGLGLNPNDMLFDPVTVAIVEEQERLIEVLKTIDEMHKLKLHSICGISNISIGMPHEVKPFIESAFLNMAMYNGLDSAILNPFLPLLMGNIFAGETVLNDRLFTSQEFVKVYDEIRKS